MSHPSTSSYPPQVQSLIADLLSSHFRFTPENFTRQIFDAFNISLYDATQLLGDHMRQRWNELNGGELQDEGEACLNSIETLLESSIDRQFDKFEIYVLRNAFSFDPSLFPYMRLDHHPNFPDSSSSSTSAEATQSNNNASGSGSPSSTRPPQLLSEFTYPTTTDNDNDTSPNEAEDQLLQSIESEYDLLQQEKLKLSKVKLVMAFLENRQREIGRVKEALDGLEGAERGRSRVPLPDRARALSTQLKSLLTSTNQLNLSDIPEPPQQQQVSNSSSGGVGGESEIGREGITTTMTKPWQEGRRGIPFINSEAGRRAGVVVSSPSAVVTSTSTGGNNNNNHDGGTAGWQEEDVAKWINLAQDN